MPRKKKTEETTTGIGRPPKWSSVEELESKIESYFQECEHKGRPLTITGLALALDTNRQTLMDYEKNKVPFSDTIKRAKLRIENFAEEQLFTNRNTAGVIFNMVNNYGWQNRMDNNMNHNGSLPIKIVDDV